MTTTTRFGGTTITIHHLACGRYQVIEHFPAGRGFIVLAEWRGLRDRPFEAGGVLAGDRRREFEMSERANYSTGPWRWVLCDGRRRRAETHRQRRRDSLSFRQQRAILPDPR